MANTTSYDLPPLPAYTLTPRPSMIPGVPDFISQMIAPIVAYWVLSAFFEVLDRYNIFAQYRLHTPAELLKRNHVSKWDVFRDVVVQQIIQFSFGTAMAWFDPIEMTGKDDYNVALYARRLRLAQRGIPTLLSLCGLDALQLSKQAQAHYPNLASLLSGGHYALSVFTDTELLLAKAIYWVGIPFIQFTVAIFWVDTWQYFLHRGMHMNKFLYTWLHARHHRLYVPYAFGALYNHPIEGFMLDTVGTGLAYLATGMTIRQGLVFFTASTIKTVDDHCGYAFPWDPLQHLTNNNAAYHDVHHQSWGIKTNFSQPFFTIWDRVLNTEWAGGDVSLRYERDRLLAQKKLGAGNVDNRTIVSSEVMDEKKAAKQAFESQKMVIETDSIQALREEQREEQEVAQSLGRSPRRKSGFDPLSLSDRMTCDLRSRRTPILHADAGS